MGGVGVSLKGLGKGKGGESPPPFKNIRTLLYKIIYTTYPLPNPLPPLLKYLDSQTGKGSFRTGANMGKRQRNEFQIPVRSPLYMDFFILLKQNTERKRCEKGVCDGH